MNYPVWYLSEIGGGLLIALIAIFHVFVSHFAVGGGLYLIYAEKKGLREHSDPILAFTKRHARFFLLLTLVFGSITGVGIWFIIGLVNPAATSLLIHIFVFGWAAEWVFFLVGIIAILVAAYRQRLAVTVGGVVLLVYLMSFMRTWLRSDYLAGVFHLDQLAVAAQYSPLVFFLVTLVGGLIVIGWLLKKTAAALVESGSSR
jgi:hypothetical protein